MPEELIALINKFAAQSDGGAENLCDVSPEDAAGDIAENFFWQYPDWQRFGVKRWQIKECLSESVYEALNKRD
jgi:hypothetical protein